MEAQLRLLTPPKVVATESGPRPRRGAGPDVPVDDEGAPALEPGPTVWRLSASTRAVGRQGVESARAALRRARAADDTTGPGQDAGRRSAA